MHIAQSHATKLIRLYRDIFSWLPLATIIDNKILVCHGGISDKTNLDYLNSIDRHQVRPLFIIGVASCPLFLARGIHEGAGDRGSYDLGLSESLLLNPARDL